MRIQLLKALFEGKRSYQQGDLLEVDKIRGKALVKQGVALEIKVTKGQGDVAQTSASEKREAVANPTTRKAARDV